MRSSHLSLANFYADDAVSRKTAALRAAGGGSGKALSAAFARHHLYGFNAFGDAQFFPGISVSGDHGDKVYRYLINGVAAGKLHDPGRASIDPIPPSVMSVITKAINADKNGTTSINQSNYISGFTQDVKQQLTALMTKPPEFDNFASVGDTSSDDDANWRQMADHFKQTLTDFVREYNALPPDAATGPATSVPYTATPAPQGISVSQSYPSTSPAPTGTMSQASLLPDLSMGGQLSTPMLVGIGALVIGGAAFFLLKKKPRAASASPGPTVAGYRRKRRRSRS